MQAQETNDFYMKYYPLSQTIAVSLSLLAGSIFVIMPATLFYEGVPVSAWLSPLGKLAAVGGILSGMSIFMAWLYCELQASKLKRTVSAVIYSTVCPVFFICILGVALLIFQGNFLNGISEPGGKENLFLILAIFAPICFGIYWSGSEKCITKLS